MSNRAPELAFKQMSSDPKKLALAYAECRRIALGHYENFPVGSILLPEHVRPHFFALYAFMRTADDLADLPYRPSNERLQALAEWRRELHRSFDPQVPDDELNPIFRALRYTCREYELSPKPFERLLDAFEYDAAGHVRFEGYDDLLGYCSNSADPVGELVLALFGYRDRERIMLSNSICSGLQLLNFCQDVREDVENGRYYFAMSDLSRLGLAAPDRLRDPASAQKAVLMQMDHVRRLLRAGAPLTERVTGRLRYELRAVVFGAMAMLRKLEQSGGRSFEVRPKLSKLGHLAILVKSLVSSPRP